MTQQTTASILTATDAYKIGRTMEYPKGTSLVNEVLIARDVNYFTDEMKTLIKKYGFVVAGVQNAIKRTEEIIKGYCEEPLDVYLRSIAEDFHNILGKEATPEYLDYYKDLYDYIGEHNKLPLEYKFVKEGTVLPVGTPYCKFHNTDPRFFWLPNFVETIFLSHSWLMTVNATVNFYLKQMLVTMSEMTCDNSCHVPYQAHDFSMRGNQGLSGTSQSAIGHLMSFSGSDSLHGIKAVEAIYGVTRSEVYGYEPEDPKPRVPICQSVSAFEHSSVTTNVQTIIKETGLDVIAAEKAALTRFITEVYPTGIVSYVADSYDFWSTIGTLKEIKDTITSRDGKLVIRPDSDDPYLALCGREYRTVTSIDEVRDERFKIGQYIKYDYIYETSTGKTYSFVMRPASNVSNPSYCAEMLLVEEEYMPYYRLQGVVRSLDEIFGSTVNAKGYKVLCDKVGAIYGDGITYDIAKKILKRLADLGYASSNVAFGMGTFWQSYYTRDNLGIALKTTYAEVDGEPVNVVKDPKTSVGHAKKSPKGDVEVYMDTDARTVWFTDSENTYDYNSALGVHILSDLRTSCTAESLLDTPENNHQDFSNVRFLLDMHGDLIRPLMKGDILNG